MVESPMTVIPACTAAMTSMMVENPTADAPMVCKKRISAGVSREGPNRPA